MGAVRRGLGKNASEAKIPVKNKNRLSCTYKTISSCNKFAIAESFLIIKKQIAVIANAPAKENYILYFPL